MRLPRPPETIKVIAEYATPNLSLSDIGPADEYDDISSDSHFDDDSDSGFSLNVSDAEFDDEDDSTENNTVAENDLSDDDSGEADDDEDDEPVSFKSFFKKK